MPPKAAADTTEGPRRSTRARTKQSAAPETEEPEAPAKQDKAATRKGDNESGVGQAKSKGKGRKRKQTAGNDPEQDDSAPAPTQNRKGSKGAKNSKQRTTQSTDVAESEDQSKGQTQPPSHAAASKATPEQHAAPAVSACDQPADSGQPAAADPACPKASCTSVVGDANVMLNQTNIGANNNKFYRMQLLQEGPDDHWLWTRWGRVGDKGQTQLQGPFDADVGLKEFQKKFRYALHVLCKLHFLCIAWLSSLR